MQYKDKTATDPICDLSAVAMATEIRSGHLSAVDVVEAHLRRIERVNPKVNAVITLDAEGALRAARDADERQAQGRVLGALHGLPVAHKDNQVTEGMRTTYGSPLFRDNVPKTTSLVVTRQRDAGAITLGKTNMPEFAAGSHTFNELFGPSRNPYDLSRSVGGSSGGAAAALATGMVALADGTDMGGSLRNPASFCNVVGLRPSHGRVPIWPNASAWSPISVAGPMGRTVGDVALLLGVLSGPDARDPMSVPGVFQMPAPLERDVRGLRIAYAPDIGGLPVESEVREVLDKAVEQLASHGCLVEVACPPLQGADEAFETMRAIHFAAAYGDLSQNHPGEVREAVRWNAAVGNALQGRQVAQAQLVHARLFHGTQAFMKDYAFIVGPVAQLAPFPVEWEYPRHIAGVAMTSYIDWMRSCCRITMTGHPAISVPCGFTAGGLPVGMQIVGRFRDELGLLQMAFHVEQTLCAHERKPAPVQ